MAPLILGRGYESIGRFNGDVFEISVMASGCKNATAYPSCTSETAPFERKNKKAFNEIEEVFLHLELHPQINTFEFSRSRRKIPGPKGVITMAMRARSRTIESLLLWFGPCSSTNSLAPALALADPRVEDFFRVAGKFSPALFDVLAAGCDE